MKHNFSGEQLRIARIFSELTLQDLAETIGDVSKQYLQQLEKGVKTPSDDMISALSDALYVEEDFFYEASSSFIAEDQCHFRKLASTPAFVKEQARIYGGLLDKFIRFVETEIELPAVNFKKVYNISQDSIEHIAEDCRELWGLGKNTPIKNMTTVLERAGAIVSYFKGVSDKVDAFSFEMTRPIIIRNDAKDSGGRLRFDLAHECGHIVMHEGIETGDAETEAQANQFASSFLLPKEAFFNEFSFLSSPRIQWGLLVERKKRWKVSLAAIFRRAHDLGIINSIQYRNANIALRRNGWAKTEIGDEFIEMESPVLIKKSLKYLEERSIGIVSCLKALHIKKEFLEKLTGISIAEPASNVIPLFKKNI